MRKIFYSVRLLLLLPLLVLTACTSLGRVDVPSQEPADVEGRAVVDGKVLPLPDQPRISSEPMSSKPVMSPVASRLLVSSETQRDAGDLESATNSLERALRIEPRNALLWNRLADVKYAQQNWQQAAQLAAKSNTLSAGNKDLRRRNWYLMANAYQALGNQQAADKYRAKLKNF